MLSASSIGEFLFRTQTLDKQQLGIFVTTPDNHDVLQCYTSCFDFNGLSLDSALRYYFASLRPPSDAQSMGLLLKSFSHKYYKDNSNTIGSAQTALGLVYRLLMLNAELHTSDGSSTRSQSTAQFIGSCRKNVQCEEVFDRTLVTMYEGIAHDKLVVASGDADCDDALAKIRVSDMPFRLVKNDDAYQVTVTLPESDSGLILRIYTSDGLLCTPSTLDFIRSRSATFEVSATSIGRKTLSFVKLGDNASQYSATELPFGRMLLVEPPFMRNVFQVKSRDKDRQTGRRITFMFSVSSQE